MYWKEAPFEDVKERITYSLSVLSKELLALEVSLQKELKEITEERQNVSDILDVIDENITHPVMKERLHKGDRVNVDVDELPAANLSSVVFTEDDDKSKTIQELDREKLEQKFSKESKEILN